jgi:hypothetical protein
MLVDPINCFARSKSSSASFSEALLFSTPATRARSSDLILDVLHGVLQIPAPAPGLRFDTVRLGHGRTQIRLRGIDGRLLHGDCVPIWLLVQLDKNIPLADAIVVIHQHPGNLAADASGDERHVTVHECVIRRYGVES